ncbi:uncharacterized protein LOC108466333 [Gossypium arboreum]|uniref:uncharacterized protein LOC108466333 n=1 Tax=Gossypium arboreum TaxID=29729 RepID=UPI0022F17D23|nr:uncharacterized protein LOC108466333 [Gossypium arboreum]
MASEDPTKVSIKLLIDQESNKVIVAEAGSDIVDIFRSLLKFPLGNIARLIGKHQCLQRAGCLNNLYNSVENLSLTSFRTDACKSMLLNPRSIYEDEYSKKLKLYMDVSEPTGYFLCRTYLCIKTGRWFSHYKTSRCSCGELMDNPTDLKVGTVANKDESEGESMFFITDDLTVMHGLPGDLMNILLNLGINNVCQIEEKVVDISSNESMLVAPNVKVTTEKDSKTRVKIMLRKSDRKILYGEASEDFVDLLFSFLTIPLEFALELLGVAQLSFQVSVLSILQKFCIAHTVI